MSPITIKCYKCGNDSEPNNMIYMGANKLICKSCFSGGNEALKPKIEKKEIKNKGDYVEYICDLCQYKFKRLKSVKVKRCPYCDKEGYIKLKSKTSAESLIHGLDEE